MQTTIRLRRDLPYWQALAAAISAFEDTYLDALLARHDSLAAASAASGLAMHDLVALLLRRGAGNPAQI